MRPEKKQEPKRVVGEWFHHRFRKYFFSEILKSGITIPYGLFYLQKLIQIFRQQIQRREYHISRIIETKYPEFILAEDKLKVLVTKWEIVKQKVTVLEERIWEVGRYVKKDGKLGNLLLWLHEAEALLNYYESDESWLCEVPAKFLLKQHEVSKISLF